MTSSHSSPKISKLKGWIALSRFLAPFIGEWSIDTIRRMTVRKDDPLPVLRMGVRIIADPVAVTAWAQRQVVS